MTSTDLAVEEINSTIANVVNRTILKQIAERPNSRLLNLEEIDCDTIEQWLRTKRTTIWSNYSISSRDSLEEAAEWFKGELDSLYRHYYLHGEG
jgi:hypothetical protein